MQIVVVTAGHIDHGKTALVKALTGTDTDRLAEEKARGMTIDLGFAYLDQSITIIDVPGHEKFIRNMVAGVSTIHIALLVIAADDGIMPQTKEHLHILKLLGVTQGIIALTKTDLADDNDWIDLVELEIQDLVANSFLKDSPFNMWRISKVLFGFSEDNSFAAGIAYPACLTEFSNDFANDASESDNTTE